MILVMTLLCLALVTVAELWFNVQTIATSPLQRRDRHNNRYTP